MAKWGGDDAFDSGKESSAGGGRVKLRRWRCKFLGFIIVTWISSFTGCGQADMVSDAPTLPWEENKAFAEGVGDTEESTVPAQGAAEPEENTVPAQGTDEPEENTVPAQGTDEPEENTVPVQGGDEPEGSTVYVQSTAEPGTSTALEEAGESVVPAQGEIVPAARETALQGATEDLDQTAESAPYWGALSVDGTKLVDGSGTPVQLRGISTHGLAWYPDYVNMECFRQLKEEWGMNVIRLAMYTAESGGYCTGGSQSELKALVKSGVEYATEFDMYVIIDWHILSDGNPNTYIEEAKDFFEEMSKAYAEYTNVLYEICNEPNGGTSWSDIKSYAEQIIEVIRNNDEDGIILVGTPNWSQYVDQAAADPIEGYDNIMYTLHFYAATHTDTLRSTMVSTIEGGLPIFVSEYGICDASGNGGINESQADQWVEVMDQYQVSYVAWNLSNKAETSAVIQSSCNKVSGFGEDDLSDSGKWLYGMLQENGSAGGIGTSGGNGGSGAGTAGSSGKDARTAGDGSGSDSGTVGKAPGTGTTENSEEGVSLDRNLQEGDSLHIAADIVNSWEQGGEFYYQYSVTITNSRGEEHNGWKIQLVFSGDITLSDKWNGNYQAEGNTLTISSMDYNGYIAADGSVGDIGFIVHGADDLAVCDMTALPDG